MQNQNPSGHESNEKPQQSLFNWVKNHKITTALIAIFYFSLNVIMNYFANNPRLFYFPAIVACFAFCWIVLSGTHKFVTSQLNGNTSTNLVETGNNLTINIPPKMGGSITTPSPSKIEDEISAARPMQQDAIAKSFIGAKVRWFLYFSSVNDSGFGFIAVFKDVKASKTPSERLQDAFPTVILCKGISNEDKNLLRLAEKDSPFFVSGTISDCKSAVSLSNCKLEAYSANTSIK
jgi:hypothetical protein